MHVFGAAKDNLALPWRCFTDHVLGCANLNYAIMMMHNIQRDIGRERVVMEEPRKRVKTEKNGLARPPCGYGCSTDTRTVLPKDGSVEGPFLCPI